MSPTHFLDLHMLPSPTVVEWWIVAQAILQKAEDASPASGAQRPPGMGKFIPAPWKGVSTVLGTKWLKYKLGAKLEGAQMRNLEYK